MVIRCFSRLKNIRNDFCINTELIEIQKCLWIYTKAYEVSLSSLEAYWLRSIGFEQFHSLNAVLFSHTFGG